MTPRLALKASRRLSLARTHRLVRYQSTTHTINPSPSTRSALSPSASPLKMPFTDSTSQRSSPPVRPPTLLTRLTEVRPIVNMSNVIFAGLLRVFGPGISFLAKEFGLGEDLKLKDMRAALYPIWRCDVLIEGKVVNEYSREKVDTKGTVAIEGGYVPGNSFAPLSYISYATQPIPDDLLVFEPGKELSQLGEGYEVIPIPFTVSPLGLLKKVRSIVGSRRDWRGLLLDEPKWQEVMVACYPIMFPIYIADFEFQKTENEKRTVTLVLDAHDNSGIPRVSTPTPPEVFGRGQLGKNYYVNPHAFLPVAHFLLPMTLSEPPQTSPSSSSSSDSDNEFRSPPGADKLIESYQYFMSPAPTSLTSVPPSPMVDVESEEGGVDWGDVRIRGWGEREENADWLKRAIGIENHLGFIQSLNESDKGEGEGVEEMAKTVEIHLDRKPWMKTTMKPMSEMREEASRDGERLRKELEESKPDWLKRWQAEAGTAESTGSAAEMESAEGKAKPTKKAR